MVDRLPWWMRRTAAICAMTALAVAGVVLIPSPSWAASFVWLLSIGVPGWLAGELVLRRDGDLTRLERFLISLGLGYALSLLLSLLLAYVPGPLYRRYALVAHVMLILLLSLAVLVRRPDGGKSGARRREGALTATVLLLAILGLAVGLRVAHLGYSEFQGDEVAVLHKAAAVIEGRDDALFLHKKGPAEILMALDGYALTGRTNELAARLPFAVASVASVAVIYALGRRWFGRRAGLWAALLWALNGFSLAFGRIVQYQSLVLLFGGLAVLALDTTHGPPSRARLALCALFVAMGLWAHTDAVFVLLPLGLLYLWREMDWRASVVEMLRSLFPGLLLGGALLALFYVPWMRHPTFAATRAYLASRGGGQPPYNNLRAALDLFTVYNAIYYVAFLAVIPMVAVFRVEARRRAMAWVLAAAGAVLCLVAGTALEDQAQAATLALGSLLLLGGIAVSRQERTWWLAVAWMALPTLTYLYGFADPRTHLYVLFPQLCLLAGAELVALLDRPVRKRVPLLGLTAVLLGLSGAYLALLFLNTDLEYKRSYPENRLPLFWTSYGDQMPEQGLFGFPYRVGWKVIGALYQNGTLQGDLGSNEEAHIIRWYTRGVEANSSQPRYYVIARDVQDEQWVSPGELADNYALVGTVGDLVDPDLLLYEREPARMTLTQYALDDRCRMFDVEATAPRYAQGMPPGDPPWGVQTPADVAVGHYYQLLGYSLDSQVAHPGEAVTLTLFWRAEGPDAAQHTVFTHIEDPGVVWGQKDRPLTTLFDHEAPYPQVRACQYVLVLADDVPAGPHALVVGAYDISNGDRLPLSSAGGQDLGTMLHLSDIIIQSQVE